MVYNLNKLIHGTGERLKINARQLLQKTENFSKEVQCSVDIEDHKFQ